MSRFKVPPQYLVVTEFLSMYKSSLTRELPSRADVSRIVSLRCSQLPLCAASLFLEYKLKGLERTMGMLMAFYVSVGTAVHTVMQHYLSRSGDFLADYYCPICHTFYPLSHKHSCCGQPTIYDEVLICFGGIVGHIDAIFKDSRGQYWILDFKTSSVSGAEKKQKDPGGVYKAQVESYALLLYKQYGIKVAGVILCFIPRDNPVNPKLWVRVLSNVSYGVIQKSLKVQIALHKAVIALTSAKEAFELLSNNKCSNPYCKYCKLTRSQLKETILKAFKTKHPLPISSLKAQIKDEPSGSIVVHRNSPGPHISETIHFDDWKWSPKMKESLSIEIAKRVALIHERTKRLPNG